MAGPFDFNLQLSSDFTDQEYTRPLIDQNANISGTAAGGAVTTIDGDLGGGAVGPIVTTSASPASTGYSFTAVGTSLTMTLTNAAQARTSLGLSKNNATNVAPTVNDDSGDGYSANSLWLDSSGPDTYICQDATVGAAIWAKINN